MPTKKIPLKNLLSDIASCRLCEQHLPLGPRPVVRIKRTAKILIIGQAPGTKVHETGIPWNDPSGDRLREWMGLTRELFYDEEHIAIMPMGFCYPGRGKSGDLPPRPECAPQWHDALMQHIPKVELTLLIGAYAQAHYLNDASKKTYANLTERVSDWSAFTPRFLPLVHPSPRNSRWLKNNPWFNESVVPYLQKRVKQILK